MKANSKLLFIRIRGLLFYILYNIIVLVISYFFDRFFQMLLFILFYSFVQECFRYRFHADTIQDNPIKAIKLCKLITIVVEVIYFIFCKDLDISVYSNLMIIFSVAFTNCLLEFSLEHYFIKKDVLKDKDKLLMLCSKAKLSKIATDRMIMKYIDNKTYQEIADIECIDLNSIKKSISRSRNKIFKG